MAYVYQGKNDCALVSIANYTGKEYSEVLLACNEFANVSTERVNKHGTPEYAIILILAKLTGKVWHISSPRRGQKTINGLISMHRAGKHTGHMVACIDGIIFDTDGIIMPIEDYKLRHNYVTRKVYSDR